MISIILHLFKRYARVDVNHISGLALNEMQHLSCSKFCLLITTINLISAHFCLFLSRQDFDIKSELEIRST